MSRFRYFIFLSVMIMMGSVSLFATDIYLPALPEMAEFFHCKPSEIQSSFTIYLLGLAACQLTYGILIDRFGRKKIILIGLSIFTIASLLCTYARSLNALIVLRLIQSMGGGVGSVVYRVIIAERFNKREAARIFSTIFPMIGLAAAIGPFIGGYLTYLFHWQSTFYFLAAFGLLNIFLVLVFLDEKQSQKSSSALKEKHPFLGYRHVLRNIEFLGYTLLLCAGFAAFRVFSAESPFVFENQGFATEEIGSFYMVLSIGYLMGNLLARKLVIRMKMDNILRIGLLFFMFGGVLMVVSTFLNMHNPYFLILPMSLVTFGNGFVFPMSSAGAMASIPLSVSGTASGLIGFLQFVFAAICVHWVGDICQGRSLIMSFFIGSIILLGLCVFFLFLNRLKDTEIEYQRDIQ